MSIIKQFIIIVTLMSFCFFGFSQKQVAITMDDIEQQNSYLPEDYKAAMLDSIVSMKIPVTIFISEGRLFTDDTLKRIESIEKWIKNPLITVGSHTYSHLYYGDTTFLYYVYDIEKGLAVSTQLTKKYDKKINYFRFPFNCLGKDSLQHHQIRKYFSEKGITITPFSVESEDWAYSAVYEYHLSKGDSTEAKKIGERYVKQTLSMFKYLEEICLKVYNRNVKQIYLCHDNLINEHYLPQIISELRKDQYEMITLDEAMTDPVYQSEDNYYKKWGISWIYRYNYDQLKDLFKYEPNDSIYQEYENLMQLQK